MQRISGEAEKESLENPRTSEVVQDRESEERPVKAPDETDPAESRPGLQDAQALAAENRDLYLRSQADIENLKKRFAREKQDWLKFANESLIRELLPVIDSLQQALQHAEDQNAPSALREGVELTLKSLLATLRKAGLEEVEAVGSGFDPKYHEAVMVLEDRGAEPGTVVKELQKGYLLNQRLLRPSMVAVSQNAADKEGA